MNLDKYKRELLKRDGLPITEDVILYSDFELYKMSTDQSIYCQSFEEALECEIDGKLVRDIIEEKEDLWQDHGGRGSGSSNARAGESLFGSRGRTTERQGGKEPGNNKNLMPPAYINTLTSSKSKSVEETAKAFGKNFLNEGREYAGLLDEQGFALKYAKGQKTSVIHLEKKGAYSIHNHPTKVLNKNGKAYSNAFSGQDLRNWALGVGKGTIAVASGNRTAYIIEKSNNFSGKAFTKAMNKVKSTGKGYDRDVDNWLKKNQKELNYKYKKVKF